MDTREAVLAFLAASLAAACVPPNKTKTDALAAKQAAHSARMDALDAELLAKQAQVANARYEAARAQCKGAVAKIQSSFARQEAACSQRVAASARCTAAQEKRKTKSMATGCLLGAAATAITGGAALPLVVGGCGGGYLYGDSTADGCPEAACESDVHVWLRAAIHEGGRLGVPSCELGVELVPVFKEVSGLRINKIDAGWPAQAAGLLPGDTIFLANNVPIGSMADWDRAKAGRESMEVCFARGQLLGCTNVEVLIDEGRPVTGLYLGAPSQVSAATLLIVGPFDPELSQGVRLEEGDVLIGIDGHMLGGADHVDAYLDTSDDPARKAGFDLVVLRGGESHHVGVGTEAYAFDRADLEASGSEIDR